MAALTSTTMQGAGQRTGTPNTLTASDTFTYLPGTGQMLLMYNPTGGTVTPNIKGSAAAAAAIPGLGGTTTAFNSGLDVAIPTLQMVLVNLDDSRNYLPDASGIVTITNGTGVIAVLLNN